MVPTSTASSAALYVLRQSVVHHAGQAYAPHAPAMPEAEEDGYFGMNTMDATARKVRLMERLGDAFGISMDDHADARSFATAIREIVGQLKLSPEGRMKLAGIEQDLGLDQLGIPIDTLIGAMLDPTGSDAEKLDAALREEMGETLADEEEAAALERLARMGLDDAGLYAG